MITTPHLAVDMIVYNRMTNSILLIKRKNNPFKNCWALPGGFVEVGETTLYAVMRELYEETGCELLFTPTLLGVYSKPDRDPRFHVVSVTYFAIFNYKLERKKLKSYDDALKSKWFKINKLPKIAFDHVDIISDFRWKENIL
jgi:8-oxo-dGTP diphosphatase